MPIRGSNVHLCLQTSRFQTQFTCSWSHLRRLVMSPFQKTWSDIWLLKHNSLWMCPQVSDGSDRKAHLATQGVQVENWMFLTSFFFIISISLRHMKQLTSALRNLLLCLTANLVITSHYIFFIFKTSASCEKWGGGGGGVDRRANCKFSLAWETGDERQVKRNQAVKVFMLHNKPNVITRPPRDWIYTFINLWSDKCRRMYGEKERTHIKTPSVVQHSWSNKCANAQCTRAQSSRSVIGLHIWALFEHKETEGSKVMGAEPQLQPPVWTVALVLLQMSDQL